MPEGICIHKKLLVIPQVQTIPTAMDNFWLESDTCKAAAGTALFKFQPSQWILTESHSENITTCISDLSYKRIRTDRLSL